MPQQKYGVNQLLSTTIKEEEEEDLMGTASLPASLASFLQRPALVSAPNAPGCSHEVTNGTAPARKVHSSSGLSSALSPAHRCRQTAVTSLAAAASKMLKRLIHVLRPDHAHPQERSRPASSSEVASFQLGRAKHTARASSAAVPAATRQPPNPIDSRLPFSPLPLNAAPPIPPAAIAAAARSSGTSISPGADHLRPQPHLVRLIDGEDVSLAMQALKLAAHVHDEMFNPRAAAHARDPRRRKALLEAARPLYDEAYAAARVVRHTALRSLVKEAVWRYVDPSRGSADDVLQLILELLTGAGGAAGGGGRYGGILHGHGGGVSASGRGRSVRATAPAAAEEGVAAAAKSGGVGGPVSQAGVRGEASCRGSPTPPGHQGPADPTSPRQGFVGRPPSSGPACAAEAVSGVGSCSGGATTASCPRPNTAVPAPATAVWPGKASEGSRASSDGRSTYGRGSQGRSSLGDDSCGSAGTSSCRSSLSGASSTQLQRHQQQQQGCANSAVGFEPSPPHGKGVWSR